MLQILSFFALETSQRTRKWAFDQSEQAAATVQGIARSMGLDEITVIPTLPPRGAHFEELQDPAEIAKVRALPPGRAREPMLSDE